MTTFDDYQTKVFRFYQEKKYSEALKAAIDASKEFPENKARTTFWIACLDSRLGNLDRAVQVLREGVQGGIWWSEDTLRDSDLDPIRTKPEFGAILAECRCLKEKSAKIAKPELLVKSPPGDSTRETWPVLMALHPRYGSPPDQTACEWSSILHRGVGLAVPWSSQVYATDGRCWDTIEISF